jgi:hypothetical protein
MELGPTLRAVDEVREQFGSTKVPIGGVDIPDQGLTRGECHDGSKGTRAIGQGGTGDRAGEGEMPRGRSSLLELELAGAPDE